MSEPIPETQEKGQVFLEDVITALQKSFSRVNSSSQENREKNPGQPTAMLGQNVQFEVSLRVNPFPAKVQSIPLTETKKAPSMDRLALSEDGQIALSLKGSINIDISYEAKNQNQD